MIFPVVTMNRRNGECYFYDGVLYLIGVISDVRLQGYRC